MFTTIFIFLSFLSSVSKKTRIFSSPSQEGSKFKAFEVLKINKFTFVNVCFQDESNAEFGVFLQGLSIQVPAQYTLTETDIEADKNGIITSCSHCFPIGSKGIIILESIRGITVTGIADGLYIGIFGNTGITALVLPSSI